MKYKLKFVTVAASRVRYGDGWIIQTDAARNMGRTNRELRFDDIAASDVYDIEGGVERYRLSIPCWWNMLAHIHSKW